MYSLHGVSVCVSHYIEDKNPSYFVACSSKMLSVFNSDVTGRFKAFFPLTKSLLEKPNEAVDIDQLTVEYKILCHAIKRSGGKFKNDLGHMLNQFNEGFSKSLQAHVSNAHRDFADHLRKDTAKLSESIKLLSINDVALRDDVLLELDASFAPKSDDSYDELIHKINKLI